MNDAGIGPLATRLAETLAGSYELEGEIGRGGMGIVFSARDLSLKRRVAIKLLPPDLAFRDEIRTRFIREAQTAARLSHPHIVPIHSVGEEGGLVYFVMGYVDGESLAARLRRRERLPTEEVRRIMKETADALGLAHAVGVIHRDIKPDNILLEGTRRRVMVTDFGIAKAREAGGGTLTGTGVALGTPAYMSPEQALGEREIDARSDIYSLGVVGYEMLVGEVPWKAPTVPGILMKQMTEPVPDVSQARADCPEDLAWTISRCLQKAPDERWPTADALRRALESRSSAPHRGRAQLAPRPERRPRGRPRDEEWWEWFEQGKRRRRPRPRTPARRERETGKPAAAKAGTKTGEPGIVRNFRSNFASYVSIMGGLLLLNVFTGIGEPWVLIPAIAWGIGLGHQYGKLWTAGYSMRDVLNRPPAPDALPPAVGQQPAKIAAAAAKTGEYGAHAGPIRQMQKDRQAIQQMVEKLPSSERSMLPEVLSTVDSLIARAVELAQTLRQMEGSVDEQALDELDRRIEEMKQKGGELDADRRLELLERQRAALAELVERRRRVEAQFESCVLAVQNVRFDLLRLRSAGVAAVLDDLTSATQEARALQVDVEAAIEAAGEIREALGKTFPR
ncbi:MAG: protein kinase [Gemmatimonadales bacterium]